MSKITRVHQKIFAKDAGPGQLGKIGSLADGAPTTTTDPLEMQSLERFHEGFYGVCLGNNSPPIQDMNSLMYLVTRQLAYLLQSGVPEWDSSTDYHTGQICIHQGKLYQSIVDNNLGQNPLTSTGKWISAVAPRSAGHVFVNSNYNITAEDNGKILLVDGSAGSVGIENDPYFDYWWGNTPYPPEYAPLDMQLPAGFPSVGYSAPHEGNMLLFLPDEAPPAGFKVTIKDAGKAMSHYWIHGFPNPSPPSSFAENPVRIVPGRMRAKLSTMWTINQYGAIYEDFYDLHKLSRAGGTYELYFDGEKWWLSSAEETLTTAERNYNGGPVFTYTEMNQLFSLEPGTDYTDLGNSEINFNKRTDKPVEITLIPSGTSLPSYVQITKGYGGNSGTAIGYVRLMKNDTPSEVIMVETEDSGSPDVHSVRMPPSVIRFVDKDSPAGQIKYKIQCKTNNPATILGFSGCVVMVREL